MASKKTPPRRSRLPIPRTLHTAPPEPTKALEVRADLNFNAQGMPAPEPQRALERLRVSVADVSFELEASMGALGSSSVLVADAVRFWQAHIGKHLDLKLEHNRNLVNEKKMRAGGGE